MNGLAIWMAFSSFLDHMRLDDILKVNKDQDVTNPFRKVA
jgi:hypothetical protein